MKKMILLASAIIIGASVEDIRATASYNQGKMQSVQCHDVMKPSMPIK
ncbi:MAG: hypothetical protein KBT39_13205 [Bacteroidales bacterium]|nr:hypothetical protein [Bacteroidales bacterium]